MSGLHVRCRPRTASLGWRVLPAFICARVRCGSSTLGSAVLGTLSQHDLCIVVSPRLHTGLYTS